MANRHKHREAGGKVSAGGGKADKPEWAGGEPQVHEEAEKKKRGGRAHMHGAKAKHRLDKPGRKTGGRVGADRSPLSSAHKGSEGHEAAD